MVRLIRLLLFSFACVGIAVGLSGCVKTDDAESGSNGCRRYDVLGTYSFDGKEYDILSLRFTEDDSYLMFSFSPLPDDYEMTTYVIFGTRKYWLDDEVDVQDVSHNDDYIFVYEDPVRYYSQYRRPQSGTYRVIRNSVDNYTVKIDFILADGTPFSMDFTGDF